MINLIPKQTLNQLQLQIYEPCVQLTPWVQCFWSLHNPLEPNCYKEKFYPDGGTSLTITLSYPEPQIHLTFNMRTCEKIVDNRHPIISARFKPAGLFSLLRLSGLPITGQFLQLRLGQDITPTWYFSLRQLVETMPVMNQGQCIMMLQEWLLVQQQMSQLTDNHTARLIDMVQKSTGSLNELVKQIGLTQRTLERRFKHETGFSPQELVTLGRIRRARQLLCCSQWNLAEIAMQCGYFDQAHFTHGFKKMVSETPLAYRKRKLSQIYNIQPEFET